MNFFQRAIKNVTRKYSKSILLIITFFFIGNLVIIGMGVANAADDAKVMTRKKMRAVVTYNIDNDAINKYMETLTDQEEMEQFNKNFPSIKLQDCKEIMADPRVSAANCISTQFGYMKKGYEFVHLGNEAEENLNEIGSSCSVDENGNKICENTMFVHFIKGNLFPNMIEFVDGGYRIVDGRFYNEEEIERGEFVVLVSKAFAELNDLMVGDTYTFYVNDPDVARFNEGVVMPEDAIAKDFEVIGIFDHKSPILPGSSRFQNAFPYENPDNMLLMPATSYYLAELEYRQIMFDYQQKKYPYDSFYSEENRPTEEKMKDMQVNDVTFLLNDPLEVDEFVRSYDGKLPQFTKLDAQNEEFKRLSKPLDTLSLYANFIIWLVVINAVIIISLVTALTLKTREYEIGVLLSIGASKFKIVAQFFIELALVAVVGFTLSVVSGSMIANKVGAKVLDFQIQESDVGEGGNNFYYQEDNLFNTNYSTSITLEDLTSEYSVTISPMIIVEIYILGLGIVLISILIPSLMIMRYNPKKILMNQN